MYVFDSGAFIELFRYYYADTFKSLWDKFDELIETRKIISVMEVKRELEDYDDRLANWVKNHNYVFLKPNQEEVDVIKHIYSN